MTIDDVSNMVRNRTIAYSDIEATLNAIMVDMTREEIITYAKTFTSQHRTLGSAKLAIIVREQRRASMLTTLSGI